MKHAGPKNRGDDAPKDDGMPRQYRQHRPIQEADQQRAHDMDDGGKDERTQAEVRDLREGGIGPAGYSRASQKIYWIPDAVVSDEAIKHRRHDHRGAPCDASLDPGHHRGRVHRQARAMAFVHFDPSHLGAHACVLEFLDFDRNRNMLRMRPHLAEPPHAAGNDEHHPEDAYARVGHQPCQAKGQAKGQYQRPRGRRRQVDYFIGYAVVCL